MDLLYWWIALLVRSALASAVKQKPLCESLASGSG